MTYRMLMCVLAVAALIALPAGNAIANVDDVAIIKCTENNAGVDNAARQPLVLTTQATFTLPASCATDVTPTSPCAPCLKALINDPFDCEGNNEFTSNVVVEQTGAVSINKFVFACDLENDDNDD